MENKPQSHAEFTEAVCKFYADVINGYYGVNDCKHKNPKQELEALIAHHVKAHIAPLVAALEAVQQHGRSTFMGPDGEKNRRASWRGVNRQIDKALAGQPTPAAAAPVSRTAEELADLKEMCFLAGQWHIVGVMENKTWSRMQEIRAKHLSEEEFAKLLYEANTLSAQCPPLEAPIADKG